MSFDADALYTLLPAVYRARDADQGYPLRQWIDLIEGQVAVLEDHIDQLYDNHFVETASPWALPYLGDLLGIRGLQAGTMATSPRAEVGHTVTYRRRKGTAAMLELLAHDVTGWPARAVEFFERVAATQHLNHVRPGCLAFASLRHADTLEFMNTPFERAMRTAEVRRIEPGRGKWNLPNVGLFLWRLRAYSMTRSPLSPAWLCSETARNYAPSQRHFRLHPMGVDTPLFTRPETEDEVTHLADPINVPLPITKRLLHSKPVDGDASPSLPQGSHPSSAYYAEGRSLLLELPPAEPGDPPAAVPANQVLICDLSDLHEDAADKTKVTGWSHEDSGRASGLVMLDPGLGRVVFPAAQERPPLATFSYGFSANLGGGEYDRADSFLVRAPHRVARVPKDAADPLSFADLDDALDAVQTTPEAEPTANLVEIRDSGSYKVRRQKLDVAERRLEVRGADGSIPRLSRPRPGPPPDPWPDTPLEITGTEAGEVSLNGLLLHGLRLRLRLQATGGLGHLHVRHCTLVSHFVADPDGRLGDASAACLDVDSAGTRVEFEDCLLGPITAGHDVTLHFKNCLIDAGGMQRLAMGDAYKTDGPSRWRLENCTVVGCVDVGILELASNTLFIGDTVAVQRRQEGCVRFCWLPAGAQVPRRYHCLPSQDAPDVRPAFTSLRLGDPAYGQLSSICPEAIRRGADDGSEMGVFHDLHQPQREDYLRARLKEYLRFGLKAGVFYPT